MSVASIKSKVTTAVSFLLLFGGSFSVLASLDVPFVLEVRQTGSGSADTNAAGFVLGAGIAAPSAPSVSNIATGGSVAANTYYFVYTYTDAVGDTVISAQSSTTTTGSASTITATSPAASTGANTWSCYVGTTSGGPYFPQGTGLTVGSNRTITATPPTTGTQPAGVDYSQQDSPQINVADGVANGTTTFTSATAGFTGAHVGNLIRVGATTWRHIVGVTNSTTIVLDATVATNTSLPVVIGGAFATHGITGAVGIIHKSKVFYKYSATLYTFSGSANVSGGTVTNGQVVAYIGYDTTRAIYNTDANRPTFKPSANSTTFINNGSTYSSYHNLIFSNPDAKTSFTALTNLGGLELISRCKFSNANLIQSGNSNDQHFEFCEFDTIATASQFTIGSTMFWCDYHDSAGFQLSGHSTIAFCNFRNVVVSSLFWLDCNGPGCVIANCNFYHAAATNDFRVIRLRPNGLIVNCVFEDINPTSTNKGYLFAAAGDTFSTIDHAYAVNCWYFNVKTAVADPATVSTANAHGITALTVSPFTLPGSGNFALNNTAGGGAAVRAASLPTTFPAGTTSNYLDAGAAQSQSTSGGGKKVGPGGGKVGMLDPRSLFPFPRSRPIITRKAG